YMHPPGISFAIFVAAVCATLLLTNPSTARGRDLTLAAAILLAALAPGVEELGILPILFALAGTAFFALAATSRLAGSPVRALADGGWLLASGPARLVIDLIAVVDEARRTGLGARSTSWLIAWIVPLVVGSIFLGLFAAANPLIE